MTINHLRRIRVPLALALLSPTLTWAAGLSFTEELHGYAFYQGEYRNTAVYLNVYIPDVDAWQQDQNKPGQVTGKLVMDRMTDQMVTGTLQVMASAPNNDGRLLTYRFQTASLQFMGVKHVNSNGRLDVIDDMTTIRGRFALAGQPLPSVSDVLYGATWTSELHFEWWKLPTLSSFIGSFKTSGVPKSGELKVEGQFLSTVFGDLAKAYFPTVFK